MLTSGALWLLALSSGPTDEATPQRYRMDMPLPPRPATLTDAPRATPRPLGEGTTLFVNFDGVELGSCNPSNSKRNCHWYNTERPFPAFSGSTATKVSVLQAMRRDAADVGVRITGQRPSSGDYTMVIYGGTEEDYDALGSAPAGDCLDQRPNQVAFAHLDGELVEWVNGGATTALHEAAHSWGLDHIDTERSIMFPSGTNEPVTFRSECDRVVADVDLTPGEASCPDINAQFCNDGNHQDARAVMEHLFGGPYVDTTPPTIELSEPRDGEYFQGPANFDVVLDIRDDLHPQIYDAAFWVGDDPRPEPKPFIEDGFAVSQLPIGLWEFHVELTDQAGHTARLDFEIEVGEDPPPQPMTDRGCAIGAEAGSGSGPGVSAAWWLVILLPGLVARRRGFGVRHAPSRRHALAPPNLLPVCPAPARRPAARLPGPDQRTRRG